MKPKLLFAYRFGILGGVATQLLNRYREFNNSFDVRVMFERDDGVSDRFPKDVAVALPRSADRVAYIEKFAPDITVIIDSPKMLSDWRSAGEIGDSVLEVHTTTSNFSYLHDLDPGCGLAGIITVSAYMEHRVSETAIGAVLPIHVVSNCLEQRWFEPLLPGNATPPQEVPIVWVGKLDGHKRVLSALDVLERIVKDCDQDRQVSPILVGGYASGSDRVKHVLETIQNRPALRRSTAWLPRVDYSKMPGLFQNAGRAGGLSLSTSMDESFGMSVAESLASGCRVVAPDVGALSEIVPAEMLYADGDFEAAVALASSMVRDPTLHKDSATVSASSLRSRMAPASTLRQFNEALAALGLT